MSDTEKNTTSPTSLRALALAPSSGFRSKVITVPEWGGAKVMLREPSGEAWMRFREIMSLELPEGVEAPKLTLQETFLRNKSADVVMLIDVLLDENGAPVFCDGDQGVVSEIYGPVHTRLLNQALNLGVSQEAAEAK